MMFLTEAEVVDKEGFCQWFCLLCMRAVFVSALHCTGRDCASLEVLVALFPMCWSFNVVMFITVVAFSFFSSFLHLTFPKITTVWLRHSSLVFSFELFTLLFMVEQRNSVS